MNEGVWRGRTALGGSPAPADGREDAGEARQAPAPWNGVRESRNGVRVEWNGDEWRTSKVYVQSEVEGRGIRTERERMRRSGEYC